MANFVITSGANSYTIEIDGKKADFISGDVIPYTPDGSGNSVYLYEIKGVLKATIAQGILSKDRIPMEIGVDSINVNGTTTFANANALLEALRAVFFLASLTYSGEFNNYTGLNNTLPPGISGRFAFVLSSEGTKWLPGSLGGTFHGAGWYYDTGSQWANKNDEIFEGLENVTFNSQIIVKQSNAASTLGGTIDPTKEYFIDGVIDCSGFSIKVPAGGMSLKGHSFDISKLICADINYTMFESPVGGSGNVLGQDYAIEVTGAGSKVYDLTSATGFDAFEFSRINYNNCTSLGETTNYRQGLEVGTGRFGGQPELTLSGTWTGGFFIDTSIVRGLVDGAYSLFKAGTTFSMLSRFRSNMNVDLNSTVSYFDFAPANFPNELTVDIDGSIVSRNSTFDPTDPNITPNMVAQDLAANWRGNTGIPNTFQGGEMAINGEAATTINTIGVYEDVAGTWDARDLDHFDEPADGQLRHLVIAPREFEAIGDIILDGGANDEVAIRLKIWDDSEGVFNFSDPLVRQVNNLVGGRDVAFFTLNKAVTLDKNDYVQLQCANLTDTGDLTAENNSFIRVKRR